MCLEFTPKCEFPKVSGPLARRPEPRTSEAQKGGVEGYGPEKWRPKGWRRFPKLEKVRAQVLLGARGWPLQARRVKEQNVPSCVEKMYGGRWSEAQSFVSALAVANVRSEPVAVQRAARQSWQRRWVFAFCLMESRPHAIDVGRGV